MYPVFIWRPIISWRFDVAEDDENNFSYAQNTVVDEVFQDDDVEYIQGRDIECEVIDTYKMPVATSVRDN